MLRILSICKEVRVVYEHKRSENVKGGREGEGHFRIILIYQASLGKSIQIYTHTYMHTNTCLHTNVQ